MKKKIYILASVSLLTIGGLTTLAALSSKFNSFKSVADPEFTITIDGSHNVLSNSTVQPISQKLHTQRGSEVTFTHYKVTFDELTQTYYVGAGGYIRNDDEVNGLYTVQTTAMSSSFSVNYGWEDDDVSYVYDYDGTNISFVTYCPTYIFFENEAEESLSFQGIKYYYTCVAGEQPAAPTAEEIEALKAEIRAFYNTLDKDDYTSRGWKTIVDTFAEAVSEIEAAKTLQKATEIKEAAITRMGSVVKQSEITVGTLFNYNNGPYEFDRDEQNNLVISYNGNPGHWKHVGTNDNLAALATNNNVFALTFRNDIDQTIQVCLQITDGGDYKADSQIVNVAGLETKTITLEYDVLCTKLYFFLDSCDDNHNRSGQITILATEFSYEDRHSDDVLHEPKDVSVNVQIAKGEDGLASAYTLTNDDYPYNIERVSALVRVDYSAATDGTKWFGFVLHAGSQKSAQLKESQAYAQEHSNKVDGKDNGYALFIFNLELTSKLSAGSKIYGQIAYGAEPQTFTVVSYRLHYGLDREVVSEKLQVNTTIYENGSGYIDGVKDNGSLTMSFAHSDFVNRGRVRKVEVEFTTLNTQTYGKSQVYFTGLNFTHFDGGSNNVLNIGPIMDTTQSGNPQTGTVTLYPADNYSLKGDGTVTAVCWWASATTVTVNSITMYTDVALPPQSVTSLEAHPVESGVVLTWVAGKYAASYDVYVNGVLNTNVTTTYAIINGLENNTEYTFGVVAKNPTGESEMITTKGTPEAGAVYDTFIETLNTDLEEMIGSSGIADMFNAGNELVNSSNNERLKSVINKMQNGQATKIAYMGGSITVGENATLKDEDHHQKGYAYYSYEWLKRTYDVQNKSEFINASISGTGSEIGIVRAQEDVLDHNPDLIFIEFAANNGSTDFYKQTYESLIRKCLSLESNPAIILLFSCTSYTMNGARTYMIPIGQHYGLPMFNFDAALREVCTPYNNKTDKSGDPIWNAFSNDGTHPNDEGHQLYAKCLCYFLRTLISKATDEPFELPSGPSQSGYDKYENLVYCNNTNSGSVITSLGSFVAANTKTNSTGNQSDVTAFQHGWKKTDTTTNDPLTIEVNAKNFILIYEAGNKSVAGDPTGNIVVTYTNKHDSTDTGTLTWDVSKTCKQTNSGSTEITDQSGSGWQNPVAIQLFDKNTADDYVITIAMETSAGICTIMAFGYTQ